jgi:hypothetical protein
MLRSDGSAASLYCTFVRGDMGANIGERWWALAGGADARNFLRFALVTDPHLSWE